MNEAIFRIFAGDKYIDIQTEARGCPLELLFELEVTACRAGTRQ